MSRAATSTVIDVFKQCVSAMQGGRLIRRESKQDKEFHFQNWVAARLQETGFEHETGGRNSYPDFRIVRFTEGYEVKGLAYPGREVNYAFREPQRTHDLLHFWPLSVHTRRRLLSRS